MKIFMSTVILLFSMQTVHAFELDIRPTDAELTRLPEYCRVKLRTPQGSPGWKVEISRMGENFMDIHHYCFGLNAINRYWGTSKPKDRTYYLGRAVGNFKYMISHKKPNFPYWGELYTNLGDAHKFSKNLGEAIQSYNKAIEVDPTYARAYMRLSEMYRDAKSLGKALEIVSEGLTRIPDSQGLQKSYLKLGGKTPYPELRPVTPTVTDVASGTPPIEGETKANETDAVLPAKPALMEPKIGSPTNPYCRFCPD